MASAVTPPTATTTTAATAATTTAPIIDHRETFQVHFPPNDTFTITSTMLRHDSPNIFSRLFLTPTPTFYESTTRQITITDKSPDLFSIILDYLRGYIVFPLNESSIPAKWLPLSKTYDNLRRDASYYGFLRLECECNKWLRRLLNPLDKQTVLKLDFTPFNHNSPSSTVTSFTSLTAEMMLECHLSDISLLRKRFLKCGGKTLTYGPMPWKQIFEQIKNPSDRDGVLQSDGSSIISVPTVFLKPPRTPADESIDCDDERKLEFSKIHISKAITQLIQDGVRPAGISNYITLRFHATDVTTNLTFSNASEGIGQFVFGDKIQGEGYQSLRLLAEGVIPPGKGLGISFYADDKVIVEVDSRMIEWDKLWEWSQLSKGLRIVPKTSTNEIKILQDTLSQFRYLLCEKYFSGSFDTETNSSIVLLLPILLILCAGVSFRVGGVYTFKKSRWTIF